MFVWHFKDQGNAYKTNCTIPKSFSYIPSLTILELFSLLPDKCTNCIFLSLLFYLFKKDKPHLSVPYVPLFLPEFSDSFHSRISGFHVCNPQHLSAPNSSSPELPFYNIPSYTFNFQQNIVQYIYVNQSRNTWTLLKLYIYSLAKSVCKSSASNSPMLRIELAKYKKNVDRTFTQK